MSHVKFEMVLSTDGDDFARRVEDRGALVLLAEYCDRAAQRMHEGNHQGIFRDVNGNTAGTWSTIEVKT